jgi:hypothetical protein
MRIYLVCLLLWVSGCRSYAFPALSERHPANSAAPESPQPALPSALHGSAEPVPDASAGATEADHGSHHHAH